MCKQCRKVKFKVTVTVGISTKRASQSLVDMYGVLFTDARHDLTCHMTNMESVCRQSVRQIILMHRHYNK